MEKQRVNDSDIDMMAKMNITNKTTNAEIFAITRQIQEAGLKKNTQIDNIGKIYWKFMAYKDELKLGEKND